MILQTAPTLGDAFWVNKELKTEINKVNILVSEDLIIDANSFASMVGEDIIDLIFEKAPKKIATRVGNSLRHYDKAISLAGVDDEMGMIRLIAAEEELVVAIFEWLKINEAKLPNHSDFVKKYKNHQVKLSFSPMLDQIGFVLADFMRHGITIDGLEDVLHWKLCVVRSDKKVTLRVTNQFGNKIFDQNPLAVSISLPGLSDDQVIEEFYDSFSRSVHDQLGLTVRQYISKRTEYRNKLLYAEDGNIFSMNNSLELIVENVFSRTLTHLLWSLAILLTNSPETINWGLINQFISLYRKLLSECNLIN